MMINEIQTLMQKRVQQVDDKELEQHVQRAAANAANNGDRSAAELLGNLLSGQDLQTQDLAGKSSVGQTASGGSLKQAVISLLTSNPQVLRYFEDAFAKDILAKI